MFISLAGNEKPGGGGRRRRRRAVNSNGERKASWVAKRWTINVTHKPDCAFPLFARVYRSGSSLSFSLPLGLQLLICLTSVMHRVVWRCFERRLILNENIVNHRLDPLRFFVIPILLSSEHPSGYSRFTVFGGTWAIRSRKKRLAPLKRKKTRIKKFCLIHFLREFKFIWISIDLRSISFVGTTIISEDN